MLPADARERYREMDRKIDASSQAPRVLGPLTRAILERREVTFDYFSRAAARPRPPRAAATSCSATAASGTCRASATRGRTRACSGWIAWRTWRLTDTSFQRPGGSSRRVPNPARTDARRPRALLQARGALCARALRLGCQAARRRRRRGACRRRHRSAGSTQWVLSFGGEAQVVEPACARGQPLLAPRQLARILESPWAFQLKIAEGKDAGKEFDFDQDSVLIGRTPECDVVLYDPGVSRKHAASSTRAADFFVEDMGSSNGTKVNGAAHQEAEARRRRRSRWARWCSSSSELVPEPAREPNTDAAIDLPRPARRGRQQHAHRLRGQRRSRA